MYFTRPSLSTLVSILVFLYLTSCHTYAEPVRSIEKEIYAAYINVFAKDLLPSKSLVIESTTQLLSDAFLGEKLSASASATKIKSLVPEASEAAIADLVRVGSNSLSFDIPKRLIRQEIQYSLADERLLREIFIGDSFDKGWKRFHRIYPSATGYISFSRVGIDVDKKQALLYVGHSCGITCGSGLMVLLQPNWGRWEIIKSVNVWIS